MWIFYDDYSPTFVSSSYKVFGLGLGFILKNGIKNRFYFCINSHIFSVQFLQWFLSWPQSHTPPNPSHSPSPHHLYFSFMAQITNYIVCSFICSLFIAHLPTLKFKLRDGRAFSTSFITVSRAGSSARHIENIQKIFGALINCYSQKVQILLLPTR